MQRMAVGVCDYKKDKQGWKVVGTHFEVPQRGSWPFLECCGFESLKNLYIVQQDTYKTAGQKTAARKRQVLAPVTVHYGQKG